MLMCVFVCERESVRARESERERKRGAAQTHALPRVSGYLRTYQDMSLKRQEETCGAPQTHALPVPAPSSWLMLFFFNGVRNEAVNEV
jgi:hypothetical protein